MAICTVWMQNTVARCGNSLLHRRSAKRLENDRLISVWPIRGGPVLHEDRIYFTAGVWPFEGTFLFSVDLNSDQVPPTYEVTTLPTNMLPQGYLAASGQNLLIPCGRG